MDIVGLDYETYYGDDFTLSKMTTEAYVRDPRFEAILLAIKVNDEKTYWVPRDDIGAALKDLNLRKRAAYAHHAHFDGLITTHHYGIRPKIWMDTLGMARAVHGANARLSLAKLAEFYKLQAKGTEVQNARGMRFADFSAAQLRAYGNYSVGDVDICYQLLHILGKHFSKNELLIISHVVKMFTEPVFILDAELLDKYRMSINAEKMSLLLQAGVHLDEVMSNDKFAAALEMIGVQPPMKISKTTGKLTYAFAKTDVGIQKLQEHEDEAVQVLVEARLKNKTTIAERGAERLIAMSKRGAATVYLKVSGASGTHRLSGGDKFNWQSMKRGSDLRNAVEAPDGAVCVVVDSSTIEARILDWISGQEDMVDVYRKQDNKTGPDMYCVIAERIYSRPISKATDPDERQMGKRTKLGLGFGMGEGQFGISVRREAKDKDGKPLVLSAEFCRFVVKDVYRASHPQVVKFWRRCEQALKSIAEGQYGLSIDYRGIVKTCRDGLLMPNGLRILFPDLKWEAEKDSEGNTVRNEFGKPRGNWTFWNGKMRERIYGPKVAENIIQCLARIVVFTQSLNITKELSAERVPNKWAHSVHDEGIFVVPEYYGPFTQQVAERNFRTQLDWCMDLPLNCESGVHRRYGKAKS